MNKVIRCFLLIFFSSIFFISDLRGTDIKSIGVPYVQNYSKSIYQAGNQNWSVSKDKNGVMYFGNSQGLLVFDGRYWQLYRMPNRLIVRAVASDEKGRVYVGGFGEFGYWEHNAKGRFVYQSLTQLIPKNYSLNDEVWKIYVDGDRVIFQSFSSIFIYQNGKIAAPIKGTQPFLFLLKAGNRFFVEGISQGLFELEGRRLSFIENSSVLGNTGILSILPFKNGSFLIGTAKNGLFIYDGKKITPWENDANGFLKTYQLNNGVKLSGDYYAFGTILNGVVILNAQGQIVQMINKSSGLQNNTVLSLYSDKEQNLWLGLDNGVDRAEINSPLYFYFDKTGRFGTVYSSIIRKNKIYLGTNQGLFYSDISLGKGFQNFDFKFIPNSQGQVWDISLIDGQLLVGHNNGTYAMQGSGFRKLSEVNGGWVVQKLPSNPDRLIQGTYTGLVIYRKDQSGNWEFSHRINNFGEPSRYVEQDVHGNVWVSHAYKGIYRLQLSDDLKEVTKSKYYDRSSGLPSSYNINVFNLENRAVFSSDSGFYVYDDIADRFIKYQQLNEKLGSFSASNKIIKAAPKKYWFINNGRVALADFTDPSKFYIDSTRFGSLAGRMVQYYENISRIGESIYLISVDEGFAIFNGDLHVRNAGKETLPRVLIRKVENTTGKIYSITEDANPSGDIEIPYGSNNIRISYALPYYRQGKVRYQYYLEGYSKEWSEWSTQTQKEFTNLGRGDYRFLVRAKVNDQLLSDTAVFEFTVLPAWYVSNWAILFYILLLTLGLFVLRKVYFIKLEKHQERIRQKLQDEQEEYLKQEAIANEQMIVKLKNEQLQSALESKSRELANSAMNIVYKNELLQKIREELKQVKDGNGKKLGDEYLKKIHKVIDEGINDDRDWNLFEKSFNETHENFFKKLKVDYPDLVPNDLKLCAYLRMNMSSKEIASILNISLRGVEIRRYRLRKKLKVAPEKNLAEFLIEL